MFRNVTVENKGYNGLNPMLFGYEGCKKFHHFGPAVRSYWVIHYVVSGFGTFKTGGREYKLGPGEMFVISPFVVSYYEADGENPWNYIWIGFTSEMSELPVKLGDVVRCPEAISIFQSMKECEKMENGRSAYLSAKLWELFSLILETNKKDTDYVEKALNIIHSGDIAELTVAVLADKVNLERTYFSELFKKKMGISPGKYIFNFRMSLAASLMVDKGENVSIASSSVGYSDIFNFSKMFKKHYGVSPTEYVKQNKNR